MAMERLAVIKETHNKTITALSYNPMKHEILVGFEGTQGILLFATSMKGLSVPLIISISAFIVIVIKANNNIHKLLVESCT